MSFNLTRNIATKGVLTFFIFLFFTAFGTAQGAYQFGLLPSINFSKKLKKDWKVNLKFQSRHLLKQGRWDTQNELNYDYGLSDFALMSSKKVGLNNKVAGGYFIRFKEDKIIQRLIQQFTIVRKYNSFRLAHRISADQTFENEKKPKYRLRYRLASEFPLNGLTLDEKEFYLKINHEYLNAFQKKDYDLEIRLVPLLGYKYSDNNKLELGFDYRINSFLSEAAEHRFWIAINWFIAL